VTLSATPAGQLVQWVLGRYPIDRRRVAIGGYSSGAQWATEYFTPIGAAQRVQADGVIVAISYGGSPKTTPVAFRKRWASRVHLHWDVGSRDWAYRTSRPYGVKAGHRWYTQRGLATSLTVAPGLGHGRAGQFGRIMETAIKAHVPR
jgi:dienelactone hydrolase